MRKALLALLPVFCAPLLAQAETPMLIKIPRLTLEASEKLAQATVAACRKEGIQIGVTVVDRSGDAMVFMRDTLAPRVTIEISRQKAYTAVNLLCTHQGGELVQTGNQWQCQTHQATFTLAGKNLVGPATTALKRLPTKVTASMVTIG